MNLVNATTLRSQESSIPTWQEELRSSIRDVNALQREFTGLTPGELSAIEKMTSNRRFVLTRYTANLVERDARNRPRQDDPIWRQLVGPNFDSRVEPALSTGTVGAGSEMWEQERDFCIENVQRKYPNRVLVRLVDSCLSYCRYCIASERTLSPQTERRRSPQDWWHRFLSLLSNDTSIEEVIVSGGDPLLLPDTTIHKKLSEIRAARPDVLIRINTRALSFVPSRITDELCSLLKNINIAAIGLHVTHPIELSTEFSIGVERLRSVVPILHSHIPLLRGVNDSSEVMRQLCMGLYRLGVSGGYLIHFAPDSPAASEFRTTLTAGRELMADLERHISGPAVPEYIVVGAAGKHRVPAVGEFRVIEDTLGLLHLKFRNWQGDVIDFRG